MIRGYQVLQVLGHNLLLSFVIALLAWLEILGLVMEARIFKGSESCLMIILWILFQICIGLNRIRVTDCCGFPIELAFSLLSRLMPFCARILNLYMAFCIGKGCGIVRYMLVRNFSYGKF